MTVVHPHLVPAGKEAPAPIIIHLEVFLVPSGGLISGGYFDVNAVAFHRDKTGHEDLACTEPELDLRSRFRRWFGAGEVVDCDAVGDHFGEVGEVEAESLGDFAGVFTNALPERERFLA